MSGYGFWGEAHHYSLQRPDQKEEINWEPDNVEEVTEFLMESHLKAFPTTPACMNRTILSTALPTEFWNRTASGCGATVSKPI
ncbi:MAG: hypothetical protein ACLRZH_16970 [Ruthenibacterium lactatiformans]